MERRNEIMGARAVEVKNESKEQYMKESKESKYKQNEKDTQRL